MTESLTRIRNNGLRAVIDLGRVLWCPGAGDTWHLCSMPFERDYVTRWNDWKLMNGSLLNSNYVLAFSVITEPTLRQIPTADVEAAIALVKQSYPQIPTLVAQGSAEMLQPNFQVPSNADWLGVVAYYTHPSQDLVFNGSVTTLKSKKQPWQRIAYALDGFYGPNHVPVAPTVADMDTIAQEWYTVASRDPEAILLGVFLWPDLTGEGAIGSMSFPQNVLDKQAAIGTAILGGKAPTYQGVIDRLDCQMIEGWAWDASQPNTPVSVVIWANNGGGIVATVRANQFRQDLLNAGIGNGQHGFSFTLPDRLRDGRSYGIYVYFSGFELDPTYLLSGSPRSISCTNYGGFLDSANCNSITGWAADLRKPNTPIKVSIFDGYNFVASAWANAYRSDLATLLGDNG